MKIGANCNIPEKETLQQVIHSYRQTPHLCTGLPPASMLFRDGYRVEFPRRSITEKEIQLAKEKDEQKTQ